MPTVLRVPTVGLRRRHTVTTEADRPTAVLAFRSSLRLLLMGLLIRICIHIITTTNSSNRRPHRRRISISSNSSSNININSSIRSTRLARAVATIRGGRQRSLLQ
jgi:hypothetical protein